jgi:hypothetical protein
VKLKPIATLVALSIASVGLAHADVNSLQAQVNQLQAQVNALGNSGSSMAGVVGVNSDLSMSMMGNQAGVGKVQTLLNARKGSMPTLTVGGYVRGDVVYDYSNPKGNFINPAINVTGATTSSATRLLLSNASLSTVADMGSWLTGFMQVGQTNIGQTTATTNLGIQNAYVVLGNLNQMPVYGFVGDKDIDFGSFQTVDMYNAPLTRTLFQAHGNTAGVGYNAMGFDGTFSLMNGGEESATVQSATSNLQYANLRTTNNSSLNNYAVNLGYGMTNGAVTWNVGAGYLAGSSFLTTSNKTNGAWDANAKVSLYGFDLLGEYVTTASKVAATTNTSNQTRAQAWDIGADYNFPVMGFKSVASVDYSGVKLSSDKNDKGSQYVAGYRVQVLNNVWTGVEYAYTIGAANYFGAAANVGSLPAGYNVTSAAGNLGDVKNQTVALDITATF